MWVCCCDAKRQHIRGTPCGNLELKHRPLHVPCTRATCYVYVCVLVRVSLRSATAACRALGHNLFDQGAGNYSQPMV